MKEDRDTRTVWPGAEGGAPGKRNRGEARLSEQWDFGVLPFPLSCLLGPSFYLRVRLTLGTPATTMATCQSLLPFGRKGPAPSPLRQNKSLGGIQALDSR